MMSDLPASPVETQSLPMLPLRDVVVFPHMVIPLFVGRPKSIKALETAMETGKNILLVAQKSAAKDEPVPEDMYEIGCLANILQMLKLPDGTVKVLVEGVQRARVLRIEDQRAMFVADVSLIPVEERADNEIEAMRRTVLAQFDQYVKLNKKIPPEVLPSLAALNGPAMEAALGFDLHGCTDVTGFGIMGHLLEMALGCKARVVVNYKNLPFYPGALEMYNEGVTTGSNKANRAMVARHPLDMRVMLGKAEEELLYDPQTSGGLLMSVAQNKTQLLLKRLKDKGIKEATIIGRVIKPGKKRITVI